MILYNQMKDRINIPKTLSVDLSNLDYSINKMILFQSSLYNSKNRIRLYKYKFPSLSVNLCFDYYSKQKIPSYIHELDKDMELEIINNGINIPLFAQIQYGKLISADDTTYAIIKSAIKLKIPYIPITLYMICNKGCDLLSDRKIDIYNKKINIANEYPIDNDEYNLISNICFPYFIFYNKMIKNDHNIDYSNYNSYTLLKKPITEYTNIDFFF